MWWMPSSFIARPSCPIGAWVFTRPGPGKAPDMKIAFLPISILGGFLAGLIGQKAFDAIWGKVDEQEPPQPEHREVSLAQAGGRAAHRGRDLPLVKGLFDHAARRGFARLTGRLAGRGAARAGVEAVHGGLAHRGSVREDTLRAGDDPRRSIEYRTTCRRASSGRPVSGRR